MPYDEESEHNWSPDERAQLDALAAEREPAAEVKRQTVDALRARGLLRPRSAITSRVGALVAIAASLVFVAGAAVGYAIAMRRGGIRANEGGATPHAVAQVDTGAATRRPTRQIIWF